MCGFSQTALTGAPNPFNLQVYIFFYYLFGVFFLPYLVACGILDALQGTEPGWALGSESVER